MAGVGFSVDRGFGFAFAFGRVWTDVSRAAVGEVPLWVALDCVTAFGVGRAALEVEVAAGAVASGAAALGIDGPAPGGASGCGVEEVRAGGVAARVVGVGDGVGVELDFRAGFAFTAPGGASGVGCGEPSLAMPGPANTSATHTASTLDPPTIRFRRRRQAHPFTAPPFPVAPYATTPRHATGREGSGSPVRRTAPVPGFTASGLDHLRFFFLSSIACRARLNAPACWSFQEP